MAIRKTEKQLKSLQNKTMIYTTALRLFSEYGYNTVTVDDICEASHLSKGTFYYYFKAKEDLVILAFFKKWIFIWNQHFQLDDQQPLVSQLCGLVSVMFEYACSKGKEWTRQSYIGQIRTQIELMIEDRSMVRILFHLIRRGLREQVFRLDYEEKEFYTIIIGTFTGLLIKWCTDPDDKYDYAKFVTNQIRVLFKDDILTDSVQETD